MDIFNKFLQSDFIQGLPVLLEHMGEGALVSIKVFFYTLIFALPLGLIVAMGRSCKIKVISYIVRGYILVMRGTPLMLQLLFFNFAPYYIFGTSMDRFTAAILSFSLNYAAYFAEIYRGGIEAVPRGQYEAASVLGYSNAKRFVKIIFPQVVKRILPPMSNEVITLVKDTSLVQILGISEIFRIANQEMSRTFTVNSLIIAAIFYLVMNWIVTKVFERAEKSLSYYN
jgi:polar amino acid transport system permease protein